MEAPLQELFSDPSLKFYSTSDRPSADEEAYKYIAVEQPKESYIIACLTTLNNLKESDKPDLSLLNGNYTGILTNLD